MRRASALPFRPSPAAPDHPRPPALPGPSHVLSVSRCSATHTLMTCTPLSRTSPSLVDPAAVPYLLIIRRSKCSATCQHTPLSPGPHHPAPAHPLLGLLWCFTFSAAPRCSATCHIRPSHLNPYTQPQPIPHRPAVMPYLLNSMKMLYNTHIPHLTPPSQTQPIPFLACCHVLPSCQRPGARTVLCTVRVPCPQPTAAQTPQNGAAPPPVVVERVVEGKGGENERTRGRCQDGSVWHVRMPCATQYALPRSLYQPPIITRCRLCPLKQARAAHKC